jgi:hypothetical protein
MITKAKNIEPITSQAIWMDVKFVLQDFIYPALKAQINHLHHYCIKHNLDESELLVLSIKNEFEQLVKQEEIELFPLLDALLQTHKNPSNFEPFKEVKKYFTAIQQNIGILLITAADKADQNLLNDIRTFEEQLNDVQFLKDKYFFVHFKNCTDCM